MQPLWCYLDPMNKELILPRIGQARNDLQYRLRTMINSGVKIAFGSDWPVTSEIPLRGLGVPVHRLDPDANAGLGWNLSEAITVDESLVFYTKNVAYQMFRENERGELDVGMTADFITLDRNLLEINPQEISAVSIKALYQNGALVGASS
jgi:predicted amidohydrolase YtcJ